ncbi:MAG: cysteine desulfurase NifS [Deltaproteobacteria bacterium RBG_13_58_19]|nr:MAG: cysteine desulfurase NifS [Deltaproteobacteria bacterium RBG_13_58_19]
MIYLDYNATTPVAPEVAAALQAYLHQEFGNPGSDYPLGRSAREAVDRARGQVAALLKCLPEEIVFTSGATEANNTVLKGVAWHFRQGHFIVSAVEHPSVRQPLGFLLAEGFDATILPVDGQGRVDPEDVRRALRPDTILISIMHANNETGGIMPLPEIGGIAREAGVWFHADAAQSVGKIPVSVAELGVDFLTLAGHKFYAPKGVGALYVRTGCHLLPLLHGGGQEGGRRAGTENVPYITALGEACRLSQEWLAQTGNELLRLRDLLHERLRAGFPELVLNGPAQERLPNTLNVSFPGFSGGDILGGIPELAASLGAACHGGVDVPSPVLTAMGVAPAVARGAVRLSLGRPTTTQEVEQGAKLLLDRIERLRK